jgi:hypothetical protein
MSRGRKRRFWAVLLGLAPLIYACSWPAVTVTPAPAQDAPQSTGGTGGAGDGCVAACANLANLGGCDMLPRSVPCEAACRKLNSHRDADGNPIIALDTVCLAGAKTCEKAQHCD